MAQDSRSNKTSPLTMAENNCVSVPHSIISESCTTQSVVKVGSTLGVASMMAGSNTVTVSATLPAAVVYHTQAIKSDAVANYELQEAKQTSLLSFPENSAGISTQTAIETHINDCVWPKKSFCQFSTLDLFTGEVLSKTNCSH